MPRTIEFEDRELVVRFTGLVHYATLTEELRIPYTAIRSVSTEAFVPPRGTIRWFGTDVPFTHIREGRFSHGGEWYFLSYEDAHRAITLYLDDFSHGDAKEPLRVVVLGTPDPAGLRDAIDKNRARPAASPSR